MSQREERIELKFRIYDGTDIGHSSYAPSMTVATLKKRLLSEWPQGKFISHTLFLVNWVNLTGEHLHRVRF